MTLSRPPGAGPGQALTDGGSRHAEPLTAGHLVLAGKDKTSTGKGSGIPCPTGLRAPGAPRRASALVSAELCPPDGGPKDTDYVRLQTSPLLKKARRK